jgi:uncharacterized protein YhaN
MAGSKSSKQRVMEKAAVASPETPKQAAEKYHRISFSVNIEEKMIDGKKALSGAINSYDFNSEELRSEFTDMEKLKAEVDKKVDEFVKAFSGKK